MTALDVIVLFAVRYALPRVHTSAAYSLLEYLSCHVNELSTGACEQIKREILAEQAWTRAGAEGDWRTILRILDCALSGLVQDESGEVTV